MLNAHLDTVGVAGMEAPFEPRIENGRLYGRGAYDMKGALAAILDAAAKVENLRGDVFITAVADEEFASIGTAAVLERVSADAAIVVEPTELQLAIAHKGFVGFELETGRNRPRRAAPGVDASRRWAGSRRAEQLDQRLQAHPLARRPRSIRIADRGSREFSTTSAAACSAARSG
jgi:acetylornithine deacetylase